MEKGLLEGATIDGQVVAGNRILRNICSLF